MTPQIRLDLDTVIDIYASSKLCLDKLPEPVKQIIGAIIADDFKFNFLAMRTGEPFHSMELVFSRSMINSTLEFVYQDVAMDHYFLLRKWWIWNLEQHTDFVTINFEDPSLSTDFNKGLPLLIPSLCQRQLPLMQCYKPS